MRVDRMMNERDLEPRLEIVRNRSETSSRAKFGLYTARGLDSG